MSEPDWKALYAEHLAQISADARAALGACDAAGLVIHAGSQRLYHADDQEVPFRQVPHFTRFAPLEGAEHLLLLPREGSPRLIQVVPEDFWHEPPGPPPTWVSDALELEVVATPKIARERAARGALGRDPERWAYVGNDLQTAAALGLPASAVEPAALLQRLDWDRGVKTRYEVASIREACLRAALGHDAVREGVTRGQSEHLLHLAYLEASGQLGRECPYETIIAWDRHAATLHYPHKQRQEPRPGRTLLIDAGATCHGYASDITRTYLRPGSHPVFHEALLGMVQLQNTLVDTVQPGLPYLVLHEAAFRGVTELLCVLGVLKVGAEEAFERRLAFPFFPHGLGHHLGLQVHDVGGKLSGPTGPPSPPPAEFPWLRTTRQLEAGHVVTIEPGLYFIPLLLNGYREGADAAAFDWELIDALIPSGGIRIEDDVLVTPEGVENLSRAFLDT